jgi:SAM-dependent methyltransferase
LNKLCELEDFGNPELIRRIRALEPDLAEFYPEYPRGREHRKSWEWAHVLLGLETLGALPSGGMALGVAAGHEPLLYELTNRVRWVFATDIYGNGAFVAGEADSQMIVNPDRFARMPYRRGRLVVQYMDALDLRFEDGTFDVVFCLSSIEHFGGVMGAARGLEEMRRVLKPAGLAAITTEVIVNGAPELSEPALHLFTHEAVRRLCTAVPGLELVEDLSLQISPATSQRPLGPRELAGPPVYPHLVLENNGRLFTSMALFFRKR